ncbi:MAG: oligosaccharide flippase family protein [Oscillospiraceae bacterium]|jgi:stage V sporulation protein B
MRKIRLFFINSIVLAAASLLLRTSGVLFNVYIAKKIGVVGMGLIEIINNVYGFAIILSLSGIGLAATRLVAEELAEKSDSGIREAVRKCLVYALFFGILAAVFLFVFSGFIGAVLIRDVRSIGSLRILSVSLPFISVSSAIYGYFTAVRRIIKSVAAQTIEQVTRIALTITALSFFAPADAGAACLIIMTASCITEIISLFILLIIFKKDAARYKKNDTTRGNILKRLFEIALPVAFSSYVCSALYTIKTLMIPLGLIKSGLSKDSAFGEYGLISGMVIPVIMFPSAFLSAFSSLLIPEVTECHRLGDYSGIDYILQKAFKATLIFAVGTVGIFLSFHDMFGQAIYKSTAAGIYIQILAPLVLIIYLDSMVDAMLKGLNEQVSSMFYNILDSAAGIVMVYFLLPFFGIKGLLFVMFVSKLFNMFLSVNRIITVTGFSFDLKNWLIKPIFCIIISLCSVNILTSLAGIPAFPQEIKLVFLTLCSGAVYFALLRLTNSITKKDVRLIKAALPI